MYNHETKIRVRYGETDMMGYVHHSNYLLYLEQARMELLYNLGINCKEMEKSGIILPVVSVNIRYSLPVFFYSFIIIKTTLREIPHLTMTFDNLILNEQNNITTKAEIIVAFADSITGKLLHPPKELIEKFKIAETHN